MLWVVFFKVHGRLQVFDANIVFSILFDSNLNIFLVFVVVMLMPLNWALESLKWKMVSNTIYPVSFATSFSAVLAGITAGFFLPNRVGEFAGKALMFPLRFFWKGTLLAVFTSIAQLFVTIGLGFIALWYFAPLVSQYLQIGLKWPFFVVAIAACAGLMFVYLNIQSVSLIFRKMSRLHRVLNTLSAISTWLKAKVLLVSLLRYLVFTLQNLLLLIIVDVELPLFDLFFLVSLMYFIMAAIPTFFITELPTRSSVMIFLFLAYYELSGTELPFAIEIRLLLAASVVWLINIVVPAIPGIYFLTRMSVLRKESK